MAFLAPAATASLRAPIYVAASSGRRSVLPAAVKATAGSGSATSPHPILSSLRMAASAAVLLAATSPALACTPSVPPPPPTPLTVTVHPNEPVQDASHPFEKLIVETAALARAPAARRLRAPGYLPPEETRAARASLAAQALFVDGKVDEAIAAFEELAREDPADYRPLFCQSVLYLVLGREAEYESVLERCREVVGDALFADPAIMASPAGSEAVDSESGAEQVEPEPAKV